MKVHFVVAGMQKCGTTTLHRLLAQHPEVHMAPIKGTHFFDTESHFAGNTVDLSAYHACFSPGPGQRVIGEATPIYSFWEPALGRIRAYNPEMKVILVLRNPIDRAYSHWNFMRHRRWERLEFEEALAAEEERARACLPLQDRRHSYVARGFYTRQLARVSACFPPEQQLVLRMESVLDPGSDAMDRIWRFLGVGRPAQLVPVHANSREYAAPMQAATRQRLRRLFADEIHALERMLGWDLADWLADREAISGSGDRSADAPEGRPPREAR